MRKVRLTRVSTVLCLLFLCALSQAQVAAPSNREAEWKSLALPATQFIRQVDEANAVFFRVPASWKKEEIKAGNDRETEYRFNGPVSTVLQISIEKISDGLPLPDYSAAILQQLRSLPGSADSLAVRRTEMSGLEAREITFTLPDVNGEPTRRLIWCAVHGPVAVAVILVEGAQHSSEIEPYLRAVVQSITIADKETFPAFSALRSATFKENKPGPIDEVQSIIATVDALNGSDREAAIAKLATIFVTDPGLPVVLLLDRRPLVRAAATVSAEALLMHSPAFDDLLLKLSLVKRGEAWQLVEIAQADSGLKLVAESLQPTINEMLERRNGKKGSGAMAQTDFARVLVLIDTNPKAALELSARLLKNSPQNRDLRFLRSLALMRTEKPDEAVKLWTELSDEQPPLAPALLKLAEHYQTLKEVSDKKKAIDLYLRYVALEPDDPRACSGLANLYEAAGDFAPAELQYRAAIECDSSNSLVYLDLAEFYAARKRFNEAVATIDEAAKRTDDKDDLFADLIGRFWLADQTDVPEGLAAVQPRRMAQSAAANLNLARIRVNHDQARSALPLLKRAATLDKTSADTYDVMATAYRKLHEWTAALNAADTAIRLSNQDSDAFYERACALARLGRRNEAIAALKRAIELDDDITDWMEDEEDLKPLATLPEFKKLLPKSEQP